MILSPTTLDTTLTTDKDLTSSAIAPSFSPLGGVQYRVVGGVIVGTDPDSVDSVEITTSDVEQARFLGASVSNFSASVGWNGDSSSCTITLAEDAGETFEVPVVGSPQFFKLRDTSGTVIWAFGGIVRAVLREVSSTQKLFIVNLESPNVILHAATVVTSDFQGEGASTSAEGVALTTFVTRSYSWGGIHNIINAFGFWENDQYGTSGAGMGMAEVNEVGMPWKKLLIATNEIINRTGTNGVAIANNVLGGSLAYSSSSYSGASSPYWYAVNFDPMVSALIEAGLPNFYRVNLSSSLSDVIQDLCDTANCQWSVVLEENTYGILSTYGDGTNLVHGIITIKANALTTTPVLGTITDWGLSQEGDGVFRRASFPDLMFAYNNDQTKKVANSRLGYELADITVGKMIVGGKRSYMYEYSDTNLFMYWGSLKPLAEGLDDLPLITPILSPVSEVDVIPIDMRHIFGFADVGLFATGKKWWGGNNEELPPTIFKGIYYASIMELRFALVEQEAWENFINNFRQKKMHDFLMQTDGPGMSKSDLSQSAYAYLASQGMTTVLDQQNFATQAFEYANRVHDNDPDIIKLKAIYDAVRRTAEMYGKEYMVPMPVNAYTWRSESKEFTPEWDTSPSAYTEGAIGANAPHDPKFWDENGRTLAYCTFPLVYTQMDLRGRRVTQELDFYEIDGSDITNIGNQVLIKTIIDPKTYYTVVPQPYDYTSGAYGNIVSNNGFDFPILLTTNNPFLGSAPYGKPTKLVYGTFYSDVRGGIPLAHISLPGRVFYPASVVGYSRDFDAIATIEQMIYRSRVNKSQRNISEVLVGSDRYQTPCESGFVSPTIMALPLQSNRFHYGPWIPTLNNYIAGKVEVQFEPDLVPENFLVSEYGLGLEGMDNAGFAMSYPDNLSYFVTESGAFTLAGASKISLGDQLVENGPYVTDINVSFSPEGLTTEFTMKTWALDFGKAKRFFIDRLKRFSKITLAMARSRRDRQTEFEKYRAGLRSSILGFNYPARYRGKSSSHIMAGYIQDTLLTKDGVDSSFKQASTSLLPVHDFVARAANSYEHMGACTLDALFVPFTTNITYDGNLPRFEEPKTSSGVYISSFNDTERINPLWNKEGITESTFRERIHNIGVVARGDEIPPNLSVKLSYAEDDFSTDDPYGNALSSDIRSMGTRVPTIKVGVGYNEDGIPAPTGVNYRWDTQQWKAGPTVDVWDSIKKTWAGQFPIMMGVMKTELRAGDLKTPSSGNIIRLVRTNTEGIKPVKISPIFSYDPSFGSAPSGTLVIYTNWEGVNVPIYVACAASNDMKTIARDFNG